MINGCEGCLKKQRKIDDLTEQIGRLKAKLRYLNRKEQQGYFGASTPSSKVPVKANATQDNRGKRGGAKPGHRGHGRRAFDETQRVVTVQSQLDHCPQCGGPLEGKGTRSHSVMDMPPLEKQPTVYVLPRQYCARCRRMYQPSVPGVLPKSLYSNRLMATTAAMHYLHGIPMGRICEQTGLSVGPLIGIFHQLGRIFAGVPSRLIEQYRQSPAKHADETSWRCDGHGGYVWLFATVTISIFVFRSTRSASVVREVLGTKPLPGTLVVDRYNGYNKAPCALQYCYAHLCRDLKEIEKQFPEDAQVRGFVDTLMPLMATAMGLRTLKISDAQFYAQAREVKSQMIEAVHRASQPRRRRGAQFPGDAPSQRASPLSLGRGPAHCCGQQPGRKRPASHGDRPQGELWFPVRGGFPNPRGTDECASHPQEAKPGRSCLDAHSGPGPHRQRPNRQSHRCPVPGWSLPKSP